MFREAERIIEKSQFKLSEEELQTAAAKLREKQFIFRDGHGQARSYDILINEQEYFKKLFESFGDTFFVDHHFGFCGIIPKSSRPALKLIDTLFLLILAKMHDHELRQARSINGRTTPSESLLLDEYCQLTGREKPKQTETRTSLERLQKMSVINLGEIQEDSEMQKIEILPSIMSIVSDDYLSLLESHVNSNSISSTTNTDKENGHNDGDQCSQPIEVSNEAEQKKSTETNINDKSQGS